MNDNDVTTTTKRRQFFRTVFQVEVLSEYPIPDGVDFAHTWQGCLDGEYSGSATEVLQETVDGPTMAELLKAQGSDPGFFQLTDDGSDTEDL